VIDRKRRPIWYTVVATTLSALFALFAASFLIRIMNWPPVITGILAAILVVFVGVRAIRSRWEVRGDRIIVRGVAITRTVHRSNIAAIEKASTLLPINVGCEAIRQRDGTLVRVPSTVRLRSDAHRRELKKLRLDLELPLDAADSPWL